MAAEIVYRVQPVPNIDGAVVLRKQSIRFLMFGLTDVDIRAIGLGNRHGRCGFSLKFCLLQKSLRSDGKYEGVEGVAIHRLKLYEM
jgi:hypothetical protein